MWKAVKGLHCNASKAMEEENVVAIADAKDLPENVKWVEMVLVLVW